MLPISTASIFRYFAIVFLVLLFMRCTNGDNNT